MTISSIRIGAWEGLRRLRHSWDHPMVVPVIVLLSPAIIYCVSIWAFGAWARFEPPLREFRPHDTALHPAGGLNEAAQEVSLRLLWAASFFVYFAISLGATSWAIGSLLANAKLRIWGTMAAAALVITALMYVVLWDRDPVYEVVGPLYFKALVFKASFLPEGIRPRFETLLNWMNLSSSITCVFLMLAACSTLFADRRPGVDEAYHLAHQIRRLRGLLYCGTVVLVARVVSIGAWLQWPVAFLDDPSKSAYGGLMLNLTTAWGAVFTLLLMATYIPIAARLNYDAAQLALSALTAGKDEKPSHKDVDKWLEDRGLHDPGAAGSVGQAQRAVAILGPLLTGPVGTLLASLSGSG